MGFIDDMAELLSEGKKIAKGEKTVADIGEETLEALGVEAKQSPPSDNPKPGKVLPGHLRPVPTPSPSHEVKGSP